MKYWQKITNERNFGNTFQENKWYSEIWGLAGKYVGGRKSKVSLKYGLNQFSSKIY